MQFACKSNGFLKFKSKFQNLFAGGCPDSLSRSGKKVFCYYEGKKSPHSIDSCPCTHLLYKNVPIDADSRVRVSPTVLSDLAALRSSNPHLHILLSIGGDQVDSQTFRAVVSRYQAMKISILTLYM